MLASYLFLILTGIALIFRTTKPAWTGQWEEGGVGGRPLWNLSCCLLPRLISCETERNHFIYMLSPISVVNRPV